MDAGVGWGGGWGGVLLAKRGSGPTKFAACRVGTNSQAWPLLGKTR